jgi:hypothetical protein
MGSDDDSITVAEFLEFELFFELAVHLDIDMTQLAEYRHARELHFRHVLRHVLLHVVTRQCRRHVIEACASRLGSPLGASGAKPVLHDGSDA